MLKYFQKMPIGAQRLIIYYSISSIPLVVYILLPLYFFMLNWTLIEIGILYTIAGIGNIVGSVVIGHLFDRGLQPKWAMAMVDFVSGLMLIVLVFAENPLEASIILFIEHLTYPLASAYQTIEKEVYPEKELESTLSYHMLLPNASQIPGFLFVGIYLTFIKSSVDGFRDILVWGAVLYLFSFLYIVLRIPKTRKHKFEGIKLMRIPKRLFGLAFAEIIIILSYSIIPEFIILNIIYNLSQFTILEIALTRIPANVAGVVGAFISDKFGSNKKAIIFSLPIISISHTLMVFILLGISHLTAVILVGLYTFISYSFHTVWFIHHRSIFYRDTPDAFKGTIFGVMMSLRLIIYTIAIPLATLITLIHPITNFLLASALMIFVLPIYTKIINSNNFIEK